MIKIIIMSLYNAESSIKLFSHSIVFNAKHHYCFQFSNDLFCKKRRKTVKHHYYFLCSFPIIVDKNRDCEKVVKNCERFSKPKKAIQSLMFFGYYVWRRQFFVLVCNLPEKRQYFFIVKHVFDQYFLFIMKVAIVIYWKSIVVKEIHTLHTVNDNI